MHYNRGMSRITKFKALQFDPWFKKVFKRLSPSDVALCESWILSHDSLEAWPFEQAVHRMFMDKPKPRRWTEITELIHCCR